MKRIKFFCVALLVLNISLLRAENDPRYAIYIKGGMNKYIEFDTPEYWGLTSKFNFTRPELGVGGSVLYQISGSRLYASTAIELSWKQVKKSILKLSLLTPNILSISSWRRLITLIFTR